MSNVLIGIIGVILFIGLALAGALFLGPRFQESANNSKAAAAVQTISQVAHAANMAGIDEGIPTQAVESVTNLIDSGHLKATPTNPIITANAPAFMAEGQHREGNARYVIMNLGDDADAVCIAIGKQTGQLATNSSSPWFLGNTSMPVSPVGCVKAMNGIATGDTPLTVGSYYAYAAI